MRAPRATYCSSENVAFTPAEFSTTTSMPALRKASLARGVIATRCSPGKLSAGTPTVITSPSGDHIVLNPGHVPEYFRHDIFLTFPSPPPNKHLEIFLRMSCQRRTIPFAID